MHRIRAVARGEALMFTATDWMPRAARGEASAVDAGRRASTGRSRDVLRCLGCGALEVSTGASLDRLIRRRLTFMPLCFMLVIRWRPTLFSLLTFLRLRPHSRNTVLRRCTNRSLRPRVGLGERSVATDF